MLKREGTLALLVGVESLFTQNTVEGDVGLGFYRWKADTGKESNNQHCIDAMRIQVWMIWQVNNVTLNPKHMENNLSGAERVETLSSGGNPGTRESGFFKQLQMVLIQVA